MKRFLVLIKMEIHSTEDIFVCAKTPPFCISVESGGTKNLFY